MSNSYLAAESARLLEALLNEQIDRFTLPNGMVVLCKEDHGSALASAQVWVRTGSIHEVGGIGSGLSHFLEHMLFKGTQRRAGREISALVQENGGNINAYTSFDRTVYYIDIPSERMPIALDILADAVFDSTLPDDEVGKERDVILREIDMCLDDPYQQLSRALFETAFREHPYRAPVIGYRELFETVSREDLLAYYRGRYAPNNAALVVTGDIDASALRDEAERHFGRFPRRRLMPAVIPPEPEQLALRCNHIDGDVHVSHGGMGYKIPHLAHPDSPALRILASVLGYGESSILWRKLRDERNLVHQVNCSVWNPGSSGLFFVSYLTDPGKREEAEQAIWREIERVESEGVSEDMIRKTVRQALAGEIEARKTMQGQAAMIGSAEVVAGDLDFRREYLRKLATVTVDDLRRVSSDYQRRQRLTLVSLNPKESAKARRPSVSRRSERSVFEQVELPNGSVILLQPDRRLPNIHFRAMLRGGPIYEDADGRGATSLLATLLTKDTARRSKEEVAEAIESAGGQMSDFAGNNTFGLSVEVMPDDLDLGMDLLGEALLSPRLRQETFEREKEAEIAALKDDLDEIFEYGRKALRQRFFGSHPMAIEPEGTVESLEAMRREHVEKLYRRLVNPNNVALAVAGDFEPRPTRERLEELLGRLPSSGFEARQAPFPRPETPGDYHAVLPRNQAIVFQAYPDFGLTHERFLVGEVADELFSGMSSLLFERVREEMGLAYFVGASRLTGVDTGMFYFHAGTHPSKVGDVYGEIEREIERVRDGKVEEAELRRCKARLKARKRMSLQTNGARAMEAALRRIFNLSVDDWRDYDRRIDAVTLRDIQAFACDLFQSDCRVRLTTGPEGVGG